MKKLLLLLFFYTTAFKSFAQPCSLPGMVSTSAIPVCGLTPFHQPVITPCTGPAIATTHCTTFPASSSRSFWYKFTCYQSGSFGFLISGISPDDDYDWVLFDITGRNPEDVFTVPSLVVSINLYGVSPGTTPPFPNSPTGCTTSGDGDVHCAGSAPDNSPFNRRPNLIVGHNYLLMVANFSTSTFGYDLTFTGGSASITDPLNPTFKEASTSCSANQIRLKLNKKMKCSSLAANGSDFTISVPGINVTAAAGIGCTNGFDMDSVLLTLSAPVPPGNHTVFAALGSDANTLLDYCDRAVPVGDGVPFVVLPLLPTPMDSLTKAGCSPTSLQLVFKKLINCNSVAPNGSDFSISGPSAVTVTGATVSCTADNYSRIITLQLAAPIQLGGIYRLTLGNGSDGNTIVDECSLQTPVGSFLDFTIADTVNANFTHSIVYGCAQNTVQYNHNGANGVNSWLWSFDGSLTNTTQNPLMTYTDFREKNTSLIVSNGVCRDTASVSIFFDNLLVAAFEGPEFACPNETATFVNQSEGTISSYAWTFGNGVNNSQRNPPPQSYPVPLTTRDETVRLIIRNSFGCADTAEHKIKVVNNCYIAVPSAFTPNNDGLNDYLYPLNAYKARDLTFSVYNRFGQRLFFTRNWLDKWDGTFKGQGADPGTYVWILQYTHVDTGLKVEQKGTVILIR